MKRDSTPVLARRVLIQPPGEEAFSRDLRQGIGAYIQEGHAWEIHVLGANLAFPWVSQLGTWKGDGAIAHVIGKEELRALRSTGVPVVSTTAFDRCPTVRNDNATIGRMGAEHLLGLGLRQFGFVGHDPLIFAGQRRDAFVSAIEAAGLGCSVFEAIEGAVEGGWEINHGRLCTWLVTLPRPVGVMACNDHVARQVLFAAKTLGINVPRELAVLGADNDEALCSLSDPALSSVILNGRRIGYEAAAMLDRLMKGEDQPRDPLLIPPVGVAARRSTDLIAIDDAQIVTAVQYIRVHRARAMNVDDLLQVVPMSRATLERRFRKAMGCSPWQEIRRVQIEHIQKLLRTTSLDIKQIAARSAMADPARLGVVFRETVGCSPSDYRIQHQGFKQTWDL